MKCEAKLVALTQPVISTPAGNPEELIAFCARVSSGRDYNTRGEDAEGLLKYCIRNKHWSIFEMANAVVEVKAPRDITRQLLRHRSFSFQEFSQRYSDDIEFTERSIRKQDETNRQNSYEDTSLPELSWRSDLRDITSYIDKMYKWYLGRKVAKECARAILPEGLTMSTLYVNGTLRSWIHYLEVRDDLGVTQQEHVVLARKIKEALLPAFPTILGMV